MAAECDHRSIYWKQEGLGGRYHCCACDIPFSLVPQKTTTETIPYCWVCRSHHELIADKCPAMYDIA